MNIRFSVGGWFGGWHAPGARAFVAAIPPARAKADTLVEPEFVTLSGGNRLNADDKPRMSVTRFLREWLRGSAATFSVRDILTLVSLLPDCPSCPPAYSPPVGRKVT